MANFKNRISVILSDVGTAELGGVLRLWLKESPLGGSYVNCKAIDPNGAYFHMTLEMRHSDSDVTDFEVQVPHAFVKAIIQAADLKKLGFV